MDNLRAPKPSAPANAALSPVLDTDSAGRDEPPDQILHCPHRLCGEALDQAQPDPQDPNRLIGICRSCETWYLIELDCRTGRYELRGPIAGTAAA